jgi:DDE superfamily endonuclease
MIIGDSLPFIRNYIASVNKLIQQNNPDHKLSRLQSYWLGFIILGLLVTNSFCWARYERFGLGRYTVKQMSWMFRRAQIMWSLLLQASVKHLISAYRIQYGVLVIDDTDIERSKNTRNISKVHTIRDKKTSGYLKGQNLIFLLLVCEKVTIPVGFYFYEPDPKKVAWRKEDARLRKKGVEKKYRPIVPDADPNYPSKKELALKLLSEFSSAFSEITIKSVVADAAYCNLDFMEKSAEYTKQPQVISQIKSSQLIIVNNKEVKISDFFKNYQGHTDTVKLRGKERTVTYRSAKLKVKSHKKKYFVIALKYEDEADYRYLIASDMTWRDIDIIKTFAFRWLVEGKPHIIPPFFN